MARDYYIEKIFPIECNGRDAAGRKILAQPVKVKVRVSQANGDEKNISFSVEECPHNTGSHHERCKASHPTIDKIGKGVACPYSADIPYAFEKRI